MTTPQTKPQPIRNADGAAPETSSDAPAEATPLRQRDDFDRDVWCVLGVPVDIAAIDDAVAEIDAAVASRARLSFVTPNVNWLVRAGKSDAARDEIRDADLSLADGAPVVALARLFGAPIASRVAGSDVFDALRRRPAFSGRKMSVFFFGGRDGAAEAACTALQDDGSALSPAGWLNPGFGTVEDMSSDAIIDEINRANPDFIVVALGAAKGQAWISRNLDRLNAPVIAHLGAVVDFTAKTVARAPALFRETGFEWLWRIKEERSLWRRYAADGLSLLRSAATGVLPQLLAYRRLKSAGAPTAQTIAGTDDIRIALAGDHLHGGLDAARKAFRRALAEGQPITLDLSGVGKVDGAFLGLLILLDKCSRKHGALVHVVGASKGLRSLLTHNSLFLRRTKPVIDAARTDMPKAAA